MKHKTPGLSEEDFPLLNLAYCKDLLGASELNQLAFLFVRVELKVGFDFFQGQSWQITNELIGFTRIAGLDQAVEPGCLFTVASCVHGTADDGNLFFS